MEQHSIINVNEKSISDLCHSFPILVCSFPWLFLSSHRYEKKNPLQWAHNCFCAMVFVPSSAIFEYFVLTKWEQNWCLLIFHTISAICNIYKYICCSFGHPLALCVPEKSCHRYFTANFIRYDNHHLFDAIFSFEDILLVLQGSHTLFVEVEPVRDCLLWNF